MSPHDAAELVGWAATEIEALRTKLEQSEESGERYRGRIAALRMLIERVQPKETTTVGGVDYGIGAPTPDYHN